MAARRTAWHCLFTAHLRRFTSPDFEIRDDVPLSTEPPRMDYLLVRRTRPTPYGAAGSTLRGLWPRLGLATVVELKTTARPYRADDLDRLWSYIHMFRTDRDNRPPLRGDLRAVLVVPARTPALLADVDEMGLGWEDLGGGYWQFHRGLFTMYVVEIDVVCESGGRRLPPGLLAPAAADAGGAAVLGRVRGLEGGRHVPARDGRLR